MTKIPHSTVARTITLDRDGRAQDPHRCLAGERCRAPETTENGKQPAQTEKPDSVCRRCYSAIRLAAEDLPNDHAALLATLDERQHIPGEKVHTSQNYSTPIDTTKHVLADEIAQQLRNAAQRIHNARKAKGEAPRNLTDCGKLITNHIQALIASPNQLEQEWCGHGESVLIAGQYRANTRTIERTGVDTAMRLVDLRKKARARINGVSTEYWRLPTRFDACYECGDPLYTNGTKVVCRSCDKDWTEQTGGLFNAEIKRQAEIERQQKMEELEAALAAAIEQRDTAWARLDAFQRFHDGLADLPPGIGLDATMLQDTLGPYLEGHPTPEQRQTSTETAE